MHQDTKPARRRRNSSEGSRREDIIEAAAGRFAAGGYDATTMRDIAKETGILAGSIYYHFSSKEELLLAVHAEAVRRIREHVAARVDPDADPWTQLRQASASYMQILADARQFAEVVLTEFPRRRSVSIYNRMVEDRDEFEAVFRRIVDKLPLKPGVDRSIFRLGLLSMLGWSVVWFREGGKTSDEIANHFVDLLQYQTAEVDGGPNEPPPPDDPSRARATAGSSPG